MHPWEADATIEIAVDDKGSIARTPITDNESRKEWAEYIQSLKRVAPPELKLAHLYSVVVHFKDETQLLEVFTGNMIRVDCGFWYHSDKKPPAQPRK